MPETAEWESANLDEHVALIKRQIDRSLHDSETFQLARKIVSGKADRLVRDPHSGADVPVVVAWGEMYRLPSYGKRLRIGDAEGESEALWDFYVTNVRYTLDPTDVDLFATLKYTLAAGAGDCDDSVIALCALHKAVGFQHVLARVITTTGESWEHVFVMIGFPKEGSPDRTKYVPLDPTVEGAQPGWQYERIMDFRDFYL